MGGAESNHRAMVRSTDSQHFSQSVLTDELTARSGRVCALRQLTATLTEHSQDYSQQHSQTQVTAL